VCDDLATTANHVRTRSSLIDKDVISVAARRHAAQRMTVLSRKDRKNRWGPESHQQPAALLVERHGVVGTQIHLPVCSDFLRCAVHDQNLMSIRNIDKSECPLLLELKTLGVTLEGNVAMPIEGFRIENSQRTSSEADVNILLVAIRRTLSASVPSLTTGPGRSDSPEKVRSVPSPPLPT